MEEESFGIWETTTNNNQQQGQIHVINIQNAQIIKSNGNGETSALILDETHQEATEGYLVDENDINNLDQIPPENLIYMNTDDGNIIEGHIVDGENETVDQQEDDDGGQQQEEYMECEVTEEVITDDLFTGEDCVQVTVDQLCVNSTPVEIEDEVQVPLPTDQDEYTTSRPYPCDFCSRRFRKKANLMNHIVAHQNDRPHVCNLCGARYIRRCDLLNHLKIHAYASDDHDDMSLQDDYLDDDDDTKNRINYNSEHDTLFSPRKDIASRRRNKSTKNFNSSSATNSYTATTSSAGKTNRKLTGAKKRKQSESTLDTSVDIDGDILTDFDYDTNITASTVYPQKYPITDPKKPFVCQHCGFCFAREKALESHSRIIHGGDSPHECNICGHMSWNLNNLKEHQRVRHPQQQESSNESGQLLAFQYICEHCDSLFDRQDQLRKHIKAVHTIKKEPIARFYQSGIEHTQQQSHHDPLDNDDEDNFIDDRRENEEEEDYDDEKHDLTYGEETNENQNDQRLSCNVCGDSFAEALDLLAHAEVHARYEPWKCQLCGEKFLEESLIKSHLRDFHPHQMNENSCAVCGKQCRNQVSLIKHAWEHSRERSHSCSKCGKTFHNKARLKRHMVSHRNKSVTCEICGDDFPDGRTLMNHRHSHTKTNQFPCIECGKTFGSRSSQQIHVRIHTGEKPYGCRFCWKAFADGGTLRKHERIHTGEKPYGCSVCPRAFNQRVVLREHIRSHHSAPDAKRGNSVTPYYCNVCGSLFSTSMDLIKHLIEHSDLATASKRQQPTGPRKYKRRRKLKPHELERLQIEKMTSKKLNNEEEMNYSDEDRNVDIGGDENDDDLLKSSSDLLLEYGENVSTKKEQQEQSIPIFTMPEFSSTTTSRATSSTKVQDQIDITGIRLLGNVLLISDSDKIKSSPAGTVSLSTPISGVKQNSRPKMIHTQKTRVPVVDGKRKTKTFITKEIKQEIVSPSSSSTNYRPRTKTVANNYQIIPSEKISPATFPILQGEDEQQQQLSNDIDVVTITTTSKRDVDATYDDLLNQNLLDEISKKDKYIDKFNSDIVNDLEEILRSPIKSNLNNNNSTAPTSVVPLSVAHESSKSPAKTPIKQERSRRQSHRKSISSSGKKSTRREIELSPPRTQQKMEQRALTASLRSQRLQSRREQQEKQQQQQRQQSFLIENIKTEEIDIDSEETVNDDGNPDDENNEQDDSGEGEQNRKKFKCEMCSASFDDRAKLLIHVPIHI
uniref:C2H2-type domain-containing protein n=1 Tax=Corethrella appendiculata TaxID=1370023 RepID=U5EEZ5_9DIPT